MIYELKMSPSEIDVGNDVPLIKITALSGYDNTP